MTYRLRYAIMLNKVTQEAMLKKKCFIIIERVTKTPNNNKQPILDSMNTSCKLFEIVYVVVKWGVYDSFLESFVRPDLKVYSCLFVLLHF